jgi:glutathione synthase
MKILFLMDPLESVIFEKDTSFILMLGAARRGHDVYYLARDGISLKNNRLEFQVEHVIPRNDPENPFKRGPGMVLSEDDIHALFIRTDPPFNHEYLMHTWLLDRLEGRIPLINRPSGIRDTNEKVWATRFTDFVPRTLITRQMDAFMAFLDEEKDVVVKPTDGFGGQSVFHLTHGAPNLRVTFETLSEHGRRDVIVQQWLPEAKVGDKRIILLNGDPLGAVLRVHGEGDHRNNFFAGGRAEAADITQRDQDIIAALKPHLIDRGLIFTGIDIIGDNLIEVNVTSPTCLQEMNTLNGVQLEDYVIDYLESVATV